MPHKNGHEQVIDPAKSPSSEGGLICLNGLAAFRNPCLAGDLLVRAGVSLIVSQRECQSVGGMFVQLHKLLRQKMTYIYSSDINQGYRSAYVVD